MRGPVRRLFARVGGRRQRGEVATMEAGWGFARRSTGHGTGCAQGGPRRRAQTSGSTVRAVPLAGVVLVALVVALFTTASVASAAPSLQIVVNNPAYETFAVDASGAAYGTPVDAPNEIWRSLDEGATWTKRADFAAGYHVSYLTPLASGALIAAAASDNGTWNLLRSDDGAVSWTQALQFPTEPCFYSTLTPHSVTEGDGFV